MELSQKTILVPGASRPIGRAIARKFSAHNARLVLPVFDWPESIEELRAEFENRAENCLILHADLRNPKSVEELKNEVINNFGSLDHLINNIERGGMPAVHGSYDEPHNAEQWELEFDTTLKAKRFLYKAFSPLLQCREGASVVNISSIAGYVGRCGSAAPFFNDGYSAANRALALFTEHWAREMAPGVRVNELMLGFIDHRHGEGTRGWSTLGSDEKKKLLTDIPLGRTASPDEVAEAVFFLAVTASYLTGSTLRMDGGFLLGGSTVPPYPPGIL